jgi:hypothetical protein
MNKFLSFCFLFSILIVSANAGPFSWITGSATLCNADSYRCETDANKQLTGWSQQCLNPEKGYFNVQLCENGCDSSTGKCKISLEQIKEQVKCTFTNSPDASQECLTTDGKFRCSGTGVCVADVYGVKGTTLAWGATCPGTAKTVIDGNNNNIAFDCTWPEPTTNTAFYITTKSCPNGIVNTPYTCDIDATTEKSVAYSISAASPWVANFAVIDINTGVVVWTNPQPAGIYKFTVEAANLLTGEVATQTYVINIAESATQEKAPVIKTQSCPDGVVGTPYACHIDAVGTGQLTYQISSVFPAVDNFAVTNMYTGDIIWTNPTPAGTYKFTVEVNDLTTGLSAFQTYVINIKTGSDSEQSSTQQFIAEGSFLTMQAWPATSDSPWYTVSVIDITTADGKPGCMIDLRKAGVDDSTPVASTQQFIAEGSFLTMQAWPATSDSPWYTVSVIDITTADGKPGCMIDLRETKPSTQAKPIETKVQQQVVCSGCSVDNVCLPIGTIKGDQYCDIDQTMKEQKIENEACGNSFECNSNLCIDHSCVSGNLWQKILKFFSKLLS